MQEWKKETVNLQLQILIQKKIICNNSYFSKATGSSTEGVKNSFAYRLANTNDQTSFFHEAPILKPKKIQKNFDLCKYAFGLVTFC